MGPLKRSHSRLSHQLLINFAWWNKISKGIFSFDEPTNTKCERKVTPTRNFLYLDSQNKTVQSSFIDFSNLSSVIFLPWSECILSISISFHYLIWMLWPIHTKNLIGSLDSVGTVNFYISWLPTSLILLFEIVCYHLV